MSFYQNNQKTVRYDEQISLNKSIKMPTDKRMYLSASSTVEAALVIPLFIYAVMVFVYLIQIVGLRIKIQEGLFYEAEILSKYSYIYEHEELKERIPFEMSPVAAQAMLISYLGVDFIESSHIYGGAPGLSMIDSIFPDNGDNIELKVTYSVKNPFLAVFPGRNTMVITQKAVFRQWVGDEAGEKDEKDSEDVKASDNEEEKVWITPGGEVYHTDRSCSYLFIKLKSVYFSQIEGLKNNNGEGYVKCSVCKKITDAGMVYVTEYGNVYHTDISCSSIKRTVIEVRLKDVKDRRLCSKCNEGKK